MRAAVLVAFAFGLARGEVEITPEAALVTDDECFINSDCGLNALQRRGAVIVHSAVQDEAKPLKKVVEVEEEGSEETESDDTETKTPATRTRTSDINECGADFDQCGGQQWTGAVCCKNGYKCLKVDEFFSQCRTTEYVAKQRGPGGFADPDEDGKAAAQEGDDEIYPEDVKSKGPTRKAATTKAPQTEESEEESDEATTTKKTAKKSSKHQTAKGSAAKTTAHPASTTAAAEALYTTTAALVNTSTLK